MKNIIVVTGGAGFVGSNLIEYLVKKTKFYIIILMIIHLEKKKNHIKNRKIKYVRSDTKNISKILNFYKKKIKAIFHFGEFSRIYQSFLNMNKCLQFIQSEQMQF